MDPAERTRTKILTRDELSARRAEARQAGQTVVQCHGCFDIVHPGHVRHLQHAARQGDILLVSITSDAQMKKGQGRPLFPQHLRAENLAALDCVDWVYVCPEATAEALLEETRPDVYIKGREYESNDDPRFRAERLAVERHGGRVIFSSGDVVFSSTALISAMEHREDPGLASLRRLAAAHDLTPARLDALVDSFAGRKVAVFGETIIDTYVLCDRPDVAGESPVMSLRPLDRASYDGGAAVIARHLAAMGARPTLVTALPRSAPAEALRLRLGAEGVQTRWVECDGPALLEKQRFLVGTQKVMKLDLVQPFAMDAARQDELLALAREAADGCDGAVIADFGCGMLSHRTLTDLCALLRRRVRVMAGDVSGRRSALLRMKHMDLLCPTEAEMRDALHDYDASLNAAVWRLMNATDTRHAIVTMGPDGLIGFERVPGAEHEAGWNTKVRGEHIPALAPFALDPLGCGDALLAAATLTLICGGSIADASFLGAVAAATEAGRLGNQVIHAADLRRGVRQVECGRLAVSSGVGPGMRAAAL